MRTVTSCGILLLREAPALEFLLLKHRNRLDLPKGHLEPGETELACALRELEEETAVTSAQVELMPDFRFTTSYQTPYRRFGGEVVEKKLIVFLALAKTEIEVKPREHGGFVWLPWNPPHRIQPETVDPLLAAVETWRPTNQLKQSD
ncbi:MAG: NUDIX domain-containing protein [Blastocatellia bacterium]|nr:NUDIX domain-containing protein [Blastocatellia bacterium]